MAYNSFVEIYLVPRDAGYMDFVRSEGTLFPMLRPLACTRYSFTSRILCTNQSSLHSPRPPALPTLLQYDCMTVAQYTTLPATSLLYAIHHTILVMTLACKRQFAQPTSSHTGVRRRPCRVRPTPEPSLSLLPPPFFSLQDIILLQSFIVGVNHPCIPPPHLQSLPYCNTIALPLRNIRPPTDLPFYAIHHTILAMALSCKGQFAQPTSSHSGVRRGPCRVRRAPEPSLSAPPAVALPKDVKRSTPTQQPTIPWSSLLRQRPRQCSTL